MGTDPYQGRRGNGSFFPQTSGYVSVGSGQTFTAPYSGELWLGINDDAVTGDVGDNSGELTANITVGGSDTTAPAIKISTPSTVYLQNQKVVAKYSCTDPDYAVASCTGTVANGARVDTSSTGPHAFSVVAADSNGNSSSQDLAYFVGNVGLAPQSLVFPPQFVDSSSKPQKVRLYNPQSTSLNISGIGASGSFADTTTCGSTLAAHASCSISVIFKPTAGGVTNGSLNVSTGAGSPSILLYGFGTPVRMFPGSLAVIV